MKNTRKTGSEKEAVAAVYLQQQGYRILEQNYRVAQAEIDIVAMDRNTLVFVEVKYRSGCAAGHPLEAVGTAKQRKICRAAVSYMNYKKIPVYETEIRFDVIGILGEEITHIQNAFDYVR
ncbi:MAG: YraN family protein [Wujia sp.]